MARLKLTVTAPRGLQLGVSGAVWKRPAGSLYRNRDFLTGTLRFGLRGSLVQNRSQLLGAVLADTQIPKRPRQALGLEALTLKQPRGALVGLSQVLHLHSPRLGLCQTSWAGRSAIETRTQRLKKQLELELELEACLEATRSRLDALSAGLAEERRAREAASRSAEAAAERREQERQRDASRALAELRGGVDALRSEMSSLAAPRAGGCCPSQGSGSRLDISRAECSEELGAPPRGPRLQATPRQPRPSQLPQAAALAPPKAEGPPISPALGAERTAGTKTPPPPASAVPVEVSLVSTIDGPLTFSTEPPSSGGLGTFRRDGSFVWAAALGGDGGQEPLCSPLQGQPHGVPRGVPPGPPLPARGGAGALRPLGAARSMGAFEPPGAVPVPIEAVGTAAPPCAAGFAGAAVGSTILRVPSPCRPGFAGGRLGEPAPGKP
ncbi:unnamed protein product [Prorocentrum cordatum]|uniref:Uncharacterized protein n=1 Tax=Prorocentrum cordatum TaxID=2364126 RepID=A0ABN9UMH6_9DINO|nr:unnamed protein product [Polarella glacialis]